VSAEIYGKMPPNVRFGKRCDFFNIKTASDRSKSVDKLKYHLLQSGTFPLTDY